MQNLILSGVTLNELLERIGQLMDEKITSQHQTKQKEQSGYLSRKEVAKLLRITLPTLHDWTKLGYLKAYRLGTRVLYKECEVKEALEDLASAKNKKGGYSHAH